MGAERHRLPIRPFAEHCATGCGKRRASGPRPTQRGQVCGFVKVTRDLTERHEREEQRLCLARTEEILRLQTEFLEKARSGVETTLVTLRVHLRSLIGSVEATGDQNVQAKLRMLDWGLDRMVRSIEQVVALAETTTAKLAEELANMQARSAAPR